MFLVEMVYWNMAGSVKRAERVELVNESNDFFGLDDSSSL
jgi:hypothetical protein